ncbi:NUDIX hydrolase [Evansella sp. AB-rgal1]|uniref:NUDIX hydrolase n=1 Tax=Evansella sp. AB-rgal1 TaxID=3242696 RepID=UPI00359E2E88
MGYIEDIRELVGTKPLILTGVAVVAINEEGQILLQKRREGIWSVPGGFMELGESAEEAGRREVFEETGIIVGKLELIEVISGKEYFVKLHNGDEFYAVTIAYVTNEIKSGSLKADGIESLEVGFFNLDNLPESLSPHLKDFINKNIHKLK